MQDFDAYDGDIGESDGPKTRRRLTDKERAACVEMVRSLIGKGWHNGRIKRAVAETFGVSPRTVEPYLTKARNLLIEESGRSKQVHQAESWAVYRSILGDKDATNLERIKAQERIDKLLGLEEPAKREISGEIEVNYECERATITVEQRRVELLGIIDSLRGRCDGATGGVSAEVVDVEVVSRSVSAPVADRP